MTPDGLTEAEHGALVRARIDRAKHNLGHGRVLKASVEADLERLLDRAERAEQEAQRLAGKVAQQRQTIGALATGWLRLLMEQRLDDGTPVLEVVFDQNPNLARQWWAALAEPSKPHGPDCCEVKHQ